MNEMLSYCGLVCNTCPIYLATYAPNKDEQARSRAEVFRICTEQYGMKITPADITDCDGCRTEGGRLFSACIKCGIRACAREKKLENCAHCGDYPCSGLETFFSSDPSAKIRLDGIRKSIHDSLSPPDQS